MRFSTVLKKISDGVDFVALKAVIGLIVLMIATITLQILSRTMAQAFTWTEELSRYLLVWSTFLGATLAYKRGMHISVTFIVESFPGKLRKPFVVFSYLLSMVFFGIAIWNGFSLMAMQIFQVSPAMQLPMRWVYLVIPLGFVIMLIHGIAMIFGELFSKQKEARR